MIYGIICYSYKVHPDDINILIDEFGSGRAKFNRVENKNFWVETSPELSQPPLNNLLMILDFILISEFYIY